jgi:L-arabinose isomerase-like protein
MKDVPPLRPAPMSRRALPDGGESSGRAAPGSRFQNYRLRVLWQPQPNLKIAATTWILAGGAHHTGFSQALTAQHLEDFADMAGLEFLLIDRNTTVPDFKKELRRNPACGRDFCASTRKIRSGPTATGLFSNGHFNVVVFPFAPRWREGRQSANTRRSANVL